VTTGPEGAFWNNWKNTAIPASGGVISNPGASNGNQGYKAGQAGTNNTNGNNVAVDPYIDDLLKMSPKQRLEAAKLLKAAGYIRTATSKYNKDLGDAYIQVNQEIAVERARSGRPELTLRQFLVENQQPLSGTGAGPNLPSRSIYKYTEADRVKMLDEVSQTLRGQNITEEDKSAKWYKDLKKSIDNMIATGTVSTSKKVKNPKTGQLEVQTVSTPGFSQEQVAATAEKAIRKATPEDVARKERVDFTSWMFSALGGK
jgi:hypothetical protein